MLDLDALSEEYITLLLEAVQVGVQHGMDVAEARMRGSVLIEPLSWEIVRERLNRDD